MPKTQMCNLMNYCPLNVLVTSTQTAPQSPGAFLSIPYSKHHPILNFIMTTSLGFCLFV